MKKRLLGVVLCGFIVASSMSATACVKHKIDDDAGDKSVLYVTNYNGISLRVVRGYDMQHKREMLSMDVLYGFKTLYPELAVRVLG